MTIVIKNKIFKRKKILTFLFLTTWVKQRVRIAKLKYQSAPCPIWVEPNKLKKNISLNKAEIKLKVPMQNIIIKKVLFICSTLSLLNNISIALKK